MIVGVLDKTKAHTAGIYGFNRQYRVMGKAALTTTIYVIFLMINHRLLFLLENNVWFLSSSGQ
ncbi:hypothetical protein BD560DRAFT_387859 [Blakeslea trispora]|nr:hypothetical protein BD560DRAFT_387859 [Blakeslea trispora]